MICGGDWDDSLPDTILNEWCKFRRELKLIEKVSVSRRLFCLQPCRFMLFGSFDASEKAYAACVYMWAENVDGNREISLVIANTRVAPVHPVSLPRLELLVALLHAELVAVVNNAMQFNVSEIHLWTDSTVALAWINSSPSRWKKFVGNRISAIQELTHGFYWDHVSGLENPADWACHGFNPCELVNHVWWWNGPSWLSSVFPTKECAQAPTCPDALQEERPTNILMTCVVKPDESLLYKYSSLRKLVRVTAWCRRYIDNRLLKIVEQRCMSKYLSGKEIDPPLKVLIRHVQSSSFRHEIQNLHNEKNPCVSSKSKLRSLNPFVDQEGSLRVGGRLRHAALPYDR